jgi:hypothetical protein
MGKLTRRQLSALIVGLSLILGLELGAASLWVPWMDQKHHVSQHKLEVALLTFYHSPDVGQSDTMSIDDLSQQTIIAQPASCVPLAVALTSISHVTRVMSWSGTVGDPPQWGNFVILRFSSAADARKTLMSKRVSGARCHSIRVSFPPFDQVSEEYRVSGHSLISLLRWNRVRYTLSGEDSYEFYVRQYANTLMWTYGSADGSSTVRAQTVDNLAARLKEKELEGL